MWPERESSGRIPDLNLELRKGIGDFEAEKHNQDPKRTISFHDLFRIAPARLEAPARNSPALISESDELHKGA
jgi:hypothetical protein